MKVTNEEGVKHLWRRMLRRLKTKESSSNKKTSIDEYSTDADYPSAKAVYGFVNDKVEEKTAICRGTFQDYSLLPNKNICQDLKHGDYAFVNGDNNLGPNTGHYLYVETPKITLNSDTRTYTFKEQVSNEGATFPYKWGGGAGVNYMEVYTAVKSPGNGSKAASSYDTPVADAEYTVYDHIVHGGWVFTRLLNNGAVPATHIQDTAAQSTNLAQVMLEAAPSGSETGEGQYSQNEINEALADPTRTKPASAVQDYVGHKTVSGTVQETELLKAFVETTPVTSRTYTAITPAQKSAASTANIAPSDAGWYEIDGGTGTQADPYIYKASTDTAVGNKTYYIPNEVGQQTQQQINERLAQRANVPLEVWAAALTALETRVEQVADVGYIFEEWEDTKDALIPYTVYTIAIADLAARIATLESNFGVLSRLHSATNDGEIVFKGLPRYFDNDGNGHDMCLTGSGAPTSATLSSFVGQHYVDTTNNKVYFATKTTGSTNDWVLLN